MRFFASPWPPPHMHIVQRERKRRMEAEEREKGLLLHLNRVLELQKNTGTPSPAAAGDKNTRHGTALPALALRQGAREVDSPEMGRLQAEVQWLKVKLAEERMSNSLRNGVPTGAELTELTGQQPLPVSPSPVSPLHQHHDAAPQARCEAAHAAGGREQGAGVEVRGTAVAVESAEGCVEREQSGVSAPHARTKRGNDIGNAQSGSLPGQQGECGLRGSGTPHVGGSTRPNKAKGSLAAASSPGQWGCVIRLLSCFPMRVYVCMPGMPSCARVGLLGPTIGSGGRCLRFAPQDAGTGKGWEKREAIIGSAKHLLDKLANKSKNALVSSTLRGESVGGGCAGNAVGGAGGQSLVRGRPDGGTGALKGPAHGSDGKALGQPSLTRARVALPPPPKRRDKLDAVGGEGGTKNSAAADKEKGGASRSPPRDRVVRCEDDRGLNVFQHASSSALAVLGLRWKEEGEEAGRGGGWLRPEDSVLSTGSMTDGSSFEMMV
jgi:hypothetical protein